MSEAGSSHFKLYRRAKDPSLEVDNLHEYVLLLQVGVRDFQLAVIDTVDEKCVLLEDFRLEEVRTVNERILVLKRLFDGHHLLTAGFWKEIVISFKTHKFTFVPSELFAVENKLDYLSISTEIKPQDDVFVSEHLKGSLSCVFTGDKKLVNWITGLYPNKKLKVIHQGLAWIESIQTDPYIKNKSIHALLDRGILHIAGIEGDQLLYYNQFAIKKPEDFLKYISLVYKELELTISDIQIIFWGGILNDSPYLENLKKHKFKVGFGKKPSYLHFSYVFDELPETMYSDVFGAYLSSHVSMTST